MTAELARYSESHVREPGSPPRPHSLRARASARLSVSSHGSGARSLAFHGQGDRLEGGEVTCSQAA